MTGVGALTSIERCRQIEDMVPDGGLGDGGAGDAGAGDAGAIDAGAIDAGAIDAGALRRPGGPSARSPWP